MTGSDTDIRLKMRAVFLAFVMVTSVFGATVAFSGTAAADGAGSVDSNNSPGASPGESINFTDNTVNVNEETTFTSVNVSGSANTAANISQIRIFNSTTGEILGTNSTVESDGNTNVTFDSPVTNASNAEPFRYTVEVSFASDGDLQNDTNLDITSAAFNTSANGNGFGSEATLSSTPGSNLVNTGNVSVQQFEQFNKDDRTNFNLSVTTPPDSANDVNTSSISVALNNTADADRNRTNVTVIENGRIVSSVANDNGTDKTTNGNATYDIDVALPEEEQGGYSVTLLGNVTDSGGNIIERVNGGAKNISKPAENSDGVEVNMTPDTLQVTPDSTKFANTDAASDSGATTSENATVNVTVLDRFGNGLNTSSSTNATVEFVGVASGTTITNTTGFSKSNRPGLPGKGTRSAPFQFNVSNSFAGDVDLVATDTDDSDTSVADGSATQTFVAPVDGVTLSSNRTDDTLPADGSKIEISAQLTDGSGNAVEVPGIQVVFSNAGGFSDAGASFQSSSATTDSSGVASVNMTANTADQSFEVRGTEQENTNTDTIQINTTPGEISDSNTKFLFNGTSVTGINADATGSSAIEVATEQDVSVRVLDNNNNAVQSKSVEYTLDGNSVATATSDTDGYANASITLPNERITDAQLNASVEKFNASTASAAGPSDAQVNISTNATAATDLQFSSDSRTLTVGSQSENIDVEVVDQFGNVNESVSQDVTIESSDTDAINFSGNAQSGATSLSNNNGVVTFTATTASGASSATLTAFTSGSGIDNISETFSVAEPDAVEVTFTSDVSTSSNGAIKNVATVEAKLTNSGNAIGVAGETVSFARQSGDAAELNQSASTFEATTNANGVATFQVNATDTTGDTTFLAIADNFTAQGTGTITTTGAATTVNVAPASSTVAPGNETTVTATFEDSEGRTVPRTGTDITLQASNGQVDGSTSSSNATQVVNGVAQATFTYNATDVSSGTDVTLTPVGGGVTGETTVTVQDADAGSPLDGAAGDADLDGDGQIDIGELGNAATEFAGGNLTIGELGDVAAAFAS